jgi:hypothetical protein
MVRAWLSSFDNVRSAADVSEMRRLISVEPQGVPRARPMDIMYFSEVILGSPEGRNLHESQVALQFAHALAHAVLWHSECLTRTGGEISFGTDERGVLVRGLYDCMESLHRSSSCMPDSLEWRVYLNMGFVEYSPTSTSASHRASHLCLVSAHLCVFPPN